AGHLRPSLSLPRKRPHIRQHCDRERCPASHPTTPTIRLVRLREQTMRAEYISFGGSVLSAQKSNRLSGRECREAIGRPIVFAVLHHTFRVLYGKRVATHKAGAPCQCIGNLVP